MSQSITRSGKGLWRSPGFPRAGLSPRREPGRPVPEPNPCRERSVPPGDGIPGDPAPLCSSPGPV